MSFSETETDVEEEKKNMKEKPVIKEKYVKLSRRSLARMEAFLASCAYALPNDAVSSIVRKKDPIQSVVPTLQSLAIRLGKKKQQESVKDGKQDKPKNVAIRTYPQIHINDLIVRLEIYIRTLRRIYGTKQSKDGEKDKVTMNECVIHLEPPRAMKTRTLFVIHSLISTCGSVGSMHQILTNLLAEFTREQLAVELLSEDLHIKIRKVCQDYEHKTSFASLAFLSTPEDSAETQLAPLLLKYVEYLQTERKKIVWECRLESTLARILDPNMRRIFKTVEFRSIGHLLDVCHEFQNSLDNVVIPARDSFFPDLSDDVTKDLSDTEQSITDLCNNTKAVKQALRDLRRETIIVNGQILPPVHSLKELISLLRERLNSRPMKLKEKKIGRMRSLGSKGSKGSGDDDESSPNNSEDVTSSSDLDFLSSGCEGDEETDAPIPKRKNSDGSNEVKNCSTPRRRQFNVDAIDILTRRLLLAASRTRGGGDAFFIVQDLFGGEGLQVVPSRSNSHGPYASGNIFASIELTVRLASITIKCHSKFDVYPENMEGCEPLIQLYTTTAETIELQEIRVDDSGLEIEVPSTNQSNVTKVMLKEKSGDNTGRRVVSIRPAKYEQVDNLHTPS